MRLSTIVVCIALLAACGDDTDTTSTTGLEQAPSDDAAAGVQGRIDALDDAVARWRGAADIATAHAAAEAAANLVVGPGGPGYGDRDGNGVVDGETDVGLLPGLDGTPEGLAMPLAANECVARDVLAGTIDDPAGAWDEMTAAIAAWTPADNTMPSLASHPMRVVGWSTFTIAGDDLDEAHEYAGHAQLHVDVTRDALGC